MSDLNQCTFTGRLGRDPELTYLANDTAVCNFSIAVGKKWRSKDGDAQEKTVWVNVKAFGKLAEVMGEYLRKGSRVCIGGELDIRKYTAKDGTEKYATEIIANHLTMLDSKKDGETRSERPAQQQAAPATSGGGFGGDPDDDIPFNKRHNKEW